MLVRILSKASCCHSENRPTRNAPHKPWSKSPCADKLFAVKNRKLALLGQQIRRLREEKNLSQEEFAGLAEIDRAYYGGIERGERNVAAVNLIKIADSLGVEVGKLFPPVSALRRATKAERGSK
jgi:DNA-binding XRE family transcriptional regulator